MATAKKKPTPAQIAARKLFAARVKAGDFKKSTPKRKANPAKKTAVKPSSAKISKLVREGYPQKQAVAIAYSEARKRKVNPAKPKTEKFKVQALNSKTSKWRQIATFCNLAEAKSYANAVARCNERIAVRVIDNA